MSHDLDEINAALALGDLFVPPSGSRCVAIMVNIGPQEYSIGREGEEYVTFTIGSSMERWKTRYTRPIYCLRRPWGPFTAYLSPLSWAVRRMLWLPKEVPPFEEWERR